MKHRNPWLGFRFDDLEYRAAQAVKEPEPKRRCPFQPKNRRQGTLDGGISRIADKQNIQSRPSLDNTEVNRFPPPSVPRNATSFGNFPEAVKEPKPKCRRPFKPKSRRQGVLDGGISRIADKRKIQSRPPLYNIEINRFPPGFALRNTTSFPIGNFPKNHVDDDDPDGSLLRELELRNATLKGKIYALEK